MTNSKSVRRMTSRLLATSALVLMSSQAAFALDDFATPTGGNVVGGSATISNPALGQVNINQSTERTVINWDSFDIGAQARTEFFQPGSNALAVNRVTGAKSDPTQILGTLKANGRVMVLDRNGVLFGQGSKVDVGGIIASTGDVDTSEVMSGAGKFAITGANGGAIVNEGEISVSESGIAGFVAPTVRNSGVINAKLGKVSLAAGDKATVDLYGDNLLELAPGTEGQKTLAENSGRISAEGGSVALTAAQAKDVVDSVVNMSGVVDVSSVSVKGGKIVLSGGKVSVKGKASANGKTAGRIEVLGSDSVLVDGELLALGDTGTGFIDTSAPTVDFGDQASILTTGEWLLDPTNITIDATREGIIETQLTTGNVTIATPLLGFQAGNISVNRTIDWSTAFTLTLTAFNDIIFNTTSSGLNATGAGNIVLNAGDDVQVLQGNGIRTNTGSFTANVDDEFEVGTNQLVQTQSGLIKVISDFFKLNGTINANVGEVRLGQDNDGGLFGFLDDEDFISVGDAGSGFGSGYHISQDELNRITAGTLTIGISDAGADNQVRVKNANFSAFNQTTINTRTPDSGSNENVLFDGVNFANNLTVNADDEIVFGANSSLSSTGDLVFNTDTNAGGFGSFEMLDNAKIDANGNDVTVNTLSVSLATGAAIDAEGGNIQLNNTDVFFAADANSLKTSGTGTINLNQVEGGSIQNAVNALGNTGTGLNTINVGSGQFNESVLVNKNNTTLKGANAGTSPNTGVRVAETIVKPNSPGFHVTGNNVTIDGFTVTDASNDGIFVDGGDYAYILNNIITNSGQNGIKMVGSEYSRINDNKIDNTIGNDGIYIHSSRGMQAWRNEITGTNDDGIQIERTLNAVLRLNKIKNTREEGIDARDTDYIGIISNEVTNAGLTTGRSGIRVSETDNAEVAYSKIDNVGGSGIDIGYGAAGRVYNNRIKNTVDAAVASRRMVGLEVSKTTATDNIGTDGIRVTDSSDVVINENTLGDIGDRGIEVRRSSNFSADLNNIDGAVNDGFFVQDVNGITITNNTINNLTGLSADGIDINRGSNAVIRRNTIGNTGSIGDDGIDVNGTLGVKIAKNKIYSAGSDGIEAIDTTDLKINWNTVEGATDNGINVSGSDGALIKGNKVSYVGSDGIQLSDSDNATVTRNVIRNTGANGIYLSDLDGVVVSNNKIGADGKKSYITLDGIYGEDLTNGLITGNTIKRASDDGIDLNTVDEVTISDNTITNAGDDGIFVGNVQGSLYVPVLMSKLSLPGLDSDLLITGNTITNAAGDGVEVQGYDGILDINTNTITDSGEDGISVSGAALFGTLLDAPSEGDDLFDGVYVTGNTVSGSDEDGIDVSGAQFAYITDNNVTNSGANGIRVSNINGFGYLPEEPVEESEDSIAAFVAAAPAAVIPNQPYGVIVRNNTVSDSGYNGVRVSDTTAALIDGNTVTRSGEDGISVSYVSGDDFKIAFLSEVLDEETDPFAPAGTYSVVVTNNTVDQTGDDGIDVENTFGRVRVAGNTVTNSGFFVGEEGPYYNEGADKRGADGITVTNTNSGFFVPDMLVMDDESGPYIPVPVDPLYAVEIVDNVVNTTGDDGIEVTSAQSALVARNNISENGVGAIIEPIEEEYEGGDANGYGADGISIRNVGGERGYMPKFLIDGPYPIGGEGPEYSVFVTQNVIDTTGDDGIEVVNAGRTKVTDNDISNTGIEGTYVPGEYYPGIYVPGYMTPGSYYGGYYYGDYYYGESNEFYFPGYYNPGTFVPGTFIPGYYYGSYYSEGYYVGGADQFGGDGIHIRGISGGERLMSLSRFTTEGETIESPDVFVSGNTVDTTLDDGIEVFNVLGSVTVDDNTVSLTGDDGIVVSKVASQNWFFEEGDTTLNIQITNNIVDQAGQDGIELNRFNDGALIANNTVSNAGDDGVLVWQAGDEIEMEGRGYKVEGSFPDFLFYGPSAVDIVDNTVLEAGDDGIEVSAVGLVSVDNNVVSDAADDGINVSSFFYSTYFEDADGDEDGERDMEVYLFAPFAEEGALVQADITNNIVLNAGSDGIQTTNIEDLLVADNLVSDSGIRGLFVGGGFNGDVAVSGNTFFNNPVGAEFESGLIDLTGDTNFFFGGDTALRFVPAIVGYEVSEEIPVEDSFSLFAEDMLVGTPIFANMSLVNDTIGTSFFAGQTTNFVELANGAFFNPGTPTVLNGLNATYLTPFGIVLPSTTGGAITQAQFDFLESRFFHFRDDATLGLFFFGFVPGVDQEDLFNTFNPFAGGSPNVNLTLLGLPRIPGVPGGGAGGGNTAFNLNNLAPAAGGEEGGEGGGFSPDQLNEIEAAAGGEDSSNASCWSDALGSASQGQVTNLNFSTDPQDAVSQQASCGQQASLQ